MADAPADAPTLPVRAERPGSLLALGLALAGPLGAQRAELPYGLQAGRRDVGIRVLPAPSQSLTLWYPASCGRRHAAPTAPCRDASPDSGRFPLLLVAPAGDRAALDTVLAQYFASHAYVVVAISYARDMTAGLEEALEVVRVLPFVDSTRIAVAGTGAGAVAARQFAQDVSRVGALAELRPVDGGSVAATGVRVPTLVLRTPTTGPAPVTSQRLTVDLPLGPSDHFRLVASVTHAFLNAALRFGALSLPDLARRLRAAGLSSHCCLDRD